MKIHFFKSIIIILLATTYFQIVKAEQTKENSVLKNFDDFKVEKKVEPAKEQKNEKSADREPASYHQPTIQNQIEKKESEVKKKKDVDTDADSKNQKEKTAPDTKESTPPKDLDKPSSENPINTPEASAGSVPEAEEPSTLTGDWGGKRKLLSEKGFDIALVYKGESGKTVQGGNKEGSYYLENLDLRMTFDLEKMAGWNGTSVFVYGLGNRGIDSGKIPTSYVGDMQATSNIQAAADDFKLYEFWAQKLFFESKASILFGLHDLNSEFYVTDSSGSFFNSSFGIGKELSQTAVNGPSIFPNTAVALRVRTEPSKNFYLQMGLFDAQASDPNEPKGNHVHLNTNDGLLMISEVAYVKQELPVKYALGFWGYSRTFDDMNEKLTDSSGGVVNKQVSSSGAYVLLDQGLTKAASVFIRYGVSNSNAKAVKDCASVGLVMKGLIPKRDNDKLSLGIAQITPSGGSLDQAKINGTSDKLAKSETTYEVNYRIELFSGLALQPDVQWVQHPSFDQTLKNALVESVRLELNF